MLGRLLKLFRGPTIHVPGTTRIAEGEARKVDVGDPGAGGRQILLCRVDGKLWALDNHCPHDKGGRIEAGPLVDGRFARCPLHNYQFRPEDGGERNGGCKGARTFRVVERDGEAELSL
jgi:nitrite reductase/ring-hydroxylating ferredoxin subunit